MGESEDEDESDDGENGKADDVLFCSWSEVSLSFFETLTSLLKFDFGFFLRVHGYEKEGIKTEQSLS